MKKIWILTPLLLGVALVGCSADRPVATGDVARPESTQSPAEPIDEMVMQEFEPIYKGNADSSRGSRVAPSQTDGAASASTQPSDMGMGSMEGMGMGGGYAPPTESEYRGGMTSDLKRSNTPFNQGMEEAPPAPAEVEFDVAPDSYGAMPGLGGRSAGMGNESGTAPRPTATPAPTTPTPMSIRVEKSQEHAESKMDFLPGYFAEPGKPVESMARQQNKKEAERLKQSRMGDTRDRLPESMTEENKPGSGVGPGDGGDKFEPIEENNFIAVADQPLSTFSIDVDTASYSKIRSYLSQFNQLPPRDAVRVEELVNYFTYDYAQPTDEHPFAANVEVASCPWNPTNRLVRVGIKGKEVNIDERPASNIVFLLDVSGSMNSANKLPLLKKGMKMLVDQLGENDKVSIVVYAGAAGIVLEPTYGYEKATILAALDRLQAGGSTNGGQGIKLAYKLATDNFIQGGTNRVILCTDGDFNVGETSTGGLVGMAAEQAKKNIYLSIMGFGIGNHNDSMLEQLSNKANGNYSFIDNDKEAEKVLVEQMSGTLLTIAKDVKIQIEFNPKKVAGYRLVGYENRLLAAQDFNDDKKDAGEIGAGHTVTAFYEIVPAQSGSDQIAAAEPMVDELKYQTKPETTDAADTNELMTLKLRYKQPESDVSTLMTYPVLDEGHQFNQATGDFQFASAVAMFGLKLRGSHFHDETNFAEIEELVASNVDGPGASYREEFLNIVRQVEKLGK
ncbi:VWA domain-containing protein [Bremerella cremea]|uniref:vWA domain-containing protein n=1 Tax=Bremerella cremea TaxID=1031537 RepID=UPI0031E86C8E